MAEEKETVEIKMVAAVEQGWTHHSARYAQTMTVHVCHSFDSRLARGCCFLRHHNARSLCGCADDGWANFGDNADGSGSGDAFAAFEDPPAPAPESGLIIAEGDASAGGDGVGGEGSGKEIGGSGADLDAAFEVNFDDADMNEREGGASAAAEKVIIQQPPAEQS